MDQREGINVLICGSSHCDSFDLVMDTLNFLHEKYGEQLTTITVSDFEGACTTAKLWASTVNEGLPADKCIKIKKFNYDGLDDVKNKPLYSNLEVPREIRENHEFYIKGTEELISHGVNMVFAYPNENGELGIGTKNIITFAEDAGITPINCAEFHKILVADKAQKEEKEAKQEVSVKNRFNNVQSLKP